ncbi:MAG: zf-HC2 domain-containing protein [Nitrospinae bacterium]|nr:zf-HC2 domain-containing protein [Nitrospinota bacterium]
MICCKECLDLLYDYLEGELDPEVSKDLEEHFEDCPPCISFLNTYKITTKLARESLGETDIPDAVKLKLQEYLKKQTR